MSDSGRETNLEALDENGLIDTNGDRCTYCRQRTGDCRPAAVHGREFIPCLCGECFNALRNSGLHDVQRDREVFYS